MRNLIPNGDLSAGVVAPWSSLLTLDTVDKPAGLPASLRTAPGAGTITSVNGAGSVFPLVGGAEYRFEAWIRADRPGSRLYLEMRDQNGAHAVESARSAGDGGEGNGGPTRWTPTHLISNREVPTSWTRLSSIIEIRPGVETAKIATAFFNHGDGAERSAVVWLAGAKLSPITDAYPIYTPGPAMLVEATQLNLSAVTARVERIVGTSTEVVTESLTALPSGGGLVVRDYEAPPGRDLTYRISTYGADGAPLDARLVGPVRMPDIDQNSAWIMDGLDPAGAMRVDLLAGTEQGVGMTVPGLALADPITGRLPVAALGTRSHHARPYIIDIDGADRMAQFEQLVAHGGVLVVRPSAAAQLPHPTGIIRLAADTVTRTDWVPWQQWARYEVSGVEVLPDAWPHLVPLHTWAEMAETLPATTWAAYAAAHPGRTWHDIAARGW